MGRIAVGILDFFFPPKCPFCQGLLGPGETLLCAACQRELPWLAGKEVERKGGCFSRCVSPLRYAGLVRQSIHRFKFEGQRGYAPAYGVLLAQCVESHEFGTFQAVTWAPVSKKRRRKRGFDQGELLAQGVARHLAVPCLPLLKKVRHTPPQSGLQEEAQRRGNVLGVYEVAKGRNISGQRILLVDDVITSGSTLEECAGELLTAGAAEVLCVTLARAK